MCSVTGLGASSSNSPFLQRRTAAAVGQAKKTIVYGEFKQKNINCKVFSCEVKNTV